MSAAKTTAVDLVERVREQDERLTTIGCLSGNAATDLRSIRLCLARAEEGNPDIVLMAIAALARVGWMVDQVTRLTGRCYQMDAEAWLLLENDDLSERIKEGVESLKGASA